MYLAVRIWTPHGLQPFLVLTVCSYQNPRLLQQNAGIFDVTSPPVCPRIKPMSTCSFKRIGQSPALHSPSFSSCLVFKFASFKNPKDFRITSAPASVKTLIQLCGSGESAELNSEHIVAQIVARRS